MNNLIHWIVSKRCGQINLMLINDAATIVYANLTVILNNAMIIGEIPQI